VDQKEKYKKLLKRGDFLDVVKQQTKLLDYGVVPTPNLTSP
jgi:hypothetical protein